MIFFRTNILVPKVFLGKTLVLSGHVTLQKLITQGGMAKYQILYMLENVTVNFKYQEWDFTIHRSKALANFYFILLVAFKLQKHCSILSTVKSRNK
jgi:hypothetical protein